MDIDFLELLSEEDSLPLIHSPLGGLLRGLSPLQQQEAYQLLSQHFGENRAKSSGLALIGLRGAGKTTLGKRVAREIGLPFLRLGGVIEKLGGMALDEMFSLGGQKAYRRLEREALEYVIEHHPVAVVEAGGSLVSEHDTFNLLRESYFTVWLQAKPEEHMQRVIRQGDTRPMEGNRQAMDDLRHILAERDPYYRTSDYSLNTSGRSVDDCLAELKRAFDGYKGGQDPAARKR